jgi:hypothetical protein
LILAAIIGHPKGGDSFEPKKPLATQFNLL